MGGDLKARADERLEAALEGGPVRDPRPLYRRVLSRLREHDPDAFQRAIRHFEEELVPAVAEDADPLQAWLDYGRLLARALGPGRALEIDATGRSRPEEEAEQTQGGPAEGRREEDDPPPLLLHIPDDDALPAVILRYPAPSTPAQDATVELLVDGRVNASRYA